MNQVHFLANAGPSTHEQIQTRVCALTQTIVDDAAQLKNLIGELERTQTAPVPSEHLSAEVLADKVDEIIRRRAMRREVFGDAIAQNPPWEILLALYSSHLRQRWETAGSVTIASGLPATTALRWLTKLHSEGLLILKQDRLDQRRRFIELSKTASQSLRQYFDGSDLQLLAA